MADRGRLLWMKFYPADWRSDIAVRALTLAARGFWWECLCIMHEAEPRGHLLINGKAPSPRELAAHLGVTVGQVRQGLKQVIDRQAASETAEGVVYSRRMVRDEEKRRRNRDNGKLGGNPRLTDSDNSGVIPLDNQSDKAGDNPSDKAHARQAQRLRGLEAQRPESTHTVGVGTSNGNGADSALRARAGAFYERYRWELYPEIRGVAYTPTRSVEGSDFDSVARLCASYDDAKVEKVARFFLEIPDDQEQFLKGKQRTLSMLLSMAAPIAERLWGNHASPA